MAKVIGATLPGSSVAEQVTVNHLVVGSIPTRAARLRFARRALRRPNFLGIFVFCALSESGRRRLPRSEAAPELRMLVARICPQRTYGQIPFTLFARPCECPSQGAFGLALLAFVAVVPPLFAAAKS
jgi:hypothetical protein